MPPTCGAWHGDAALPHSHSSTSFSSSTSCGCSPPSCGKPMLAGVTRGSSTGKPPCRAQAPQNSEVVQRQHHAQKQGRGPKHEPVSRDSSCLPNWPHPEARGSHPASAGPRGTPKPARATQGKCYTGAAVCKGGGQTQTSPQRAGHRESEGQVGSGAASGRREGAAQLKPEEWAVG